MAVIRQKSSGTEPQTKAETDSKRMVRPVLASKLNRQPLGRWKRFAKDKESVRSGRRNQREGRKVFGSSSRSEKSASSRRSEMMFWVKRRIENAEDRQFFLPPPRRWIFAASQRSYQNIYKKECCKIHQRLPQFWNVNQRILNQDQKDPSWTFPSSLCFLGNSQWVAKEKWFTVEINIEH